MKHNKKYTVDKWIKETIKRYGIDVVLKYPWECLFLTQSRLEGLRK